MAKILHRMAHGDARKTDPALLKSVADNLVGKTICPFGEAMGWPVQSYTAKFKDEFAAKVAPKPAQLADDPVEKPQEVARA